MLLHSINPSSALRGVKLILPPEFGAAMAAEELTDQMLRLSPMSLYYTCNRFPRRRVVLTLIANTANFGLHVYQAMMKLCL